MCTFVCGKEGGLSEKFIGEEIAFRHNELRLMLFHDRCLSNTARTYRKGSTLDTYKAPTKNVRKHSKSYLLASSQRNLAEVFAWQIKTVKNES